MTIAPTPGGNITHADSRFVSPYGEVVVSWRIESHDDDDEAEGALGHRNGFYLEVRVPPNTKATVSVPKSRSEAGVEFQDAVEVGSGYHEWFVGGFV